MAEKVCVKCEVELRVKANGIAVVSMATWGPLSLYRADLWTCPVCGYEALIGFGQQEAVHRFDTDLEAHINSLEKCGHRVLRFWLNQREKDLWRRANNLPAMTTT